jgi:3-deoxy-D-manno-octulosonic-acid transferase
MSGLLESAYGLAWRLAIPLLSRHRRLREGLDERTLKSGPPDKARVWIQAASGGEAFLAWEVLRCLKPPAGGELSVLCTTNTSQGLGVLRQAAASPDLDPGLRVRTRYFPFDAPGLMGRAVAAASPEVAVLLESELWPGFLAACRRHGTRVLLANGRMTAKSLAGYRRFPGSSRLLAPDFVLAMSPEDARRFEALFGRQRVGLMPNIKFDRLSRSSAPSGDNPLIGLMAPDTDFVVLGSVRREEEGQAAAILAGLLERAPRTVAGLFPRHMERVEPWLKRLTRAGLPCVRRSSLNAPAAPGTVVLWDVFGELGRAYGLARAAFVGGSLAPLGGQNFLEPLGLGTPTVIGPHWENFAWVGRAVLDLDALREARDVSGVLEALLAFLGRPLHREAVRRAVLDYAAGRTGGSAAVCGRIAQWLENT